jgi:hypothetical protein
MLSAGKFQIIQPVALHFPHLLTARKTFDTSGKSPADYHHRENRAGPGGEIRRGLFV